MSKVLKWWLVFCLSIVVGYIAHIFGWTWEIYSKDTTKISVLIIALYLISSLFVGKLAYDQSKNQGISERLEVAWFISDTMLTLGMIGTVAGFILMLGDSFANIDTNNPETLKTALTGMALGMSTALYTTLVGLVCSQTLKIQLVNLESGKE
jgi:F0F1-type ATP synthase membrane subunit c/vacuolar-type H+-ATPase subunit K